jgi:hypothetical protein
MNVRDATVEPMLETDAPLASRQQMNAEPNLPEDDRVDDERLFVRAKPFHDASVRAWLGGLAQNACVDEVRHPSEIVGRLGLERYEPPLLRARQQPVDQPLVGRSKAHQPILSATDTFDLELLPWLDGVLSAELSGEDDLASARHGRLHGGVR